MGMHADCGHGIITVTSMAQLHMQAITCKVTRHRDICKLGTNKRPHTSPTLHSLTRLFLMSASSPFRANCDVTSTCPLSRSMAALLAPDCF